MNGFPGLGCSGPCERNADNLMAELWQAAAHMTWKPHPQPSLPSSVHSCANTQSAGPPSHDHLSVTCTTRRPGNLLFPKERTLPGARMDIPASPAFLEWDFDMELSTGLLARLLSSLPPAHSGTQHGARRALLPRPHQLRRLLLGRASPHSLPNPPALLQAGPS